MDILVNEITGAAAEKVTHIAEEVGEKEKDIVEKIRNLSTKSEK